MKLLKQYTGDYVAELEALEALEDLEPLKELEALENLNDIAYYEDGYGDLARQSYLTLKVAIKRNEPMKPLLKDMGFGHYDIYCPSCKEYIGYKNSVRQSLTLKYCPDCGQRLDWSDEK